jgi:serine/threonine protein kinase
MLEQHSLREKTQFRLCHDVARALHFLHTCFIVHGDVKSENVLIFQHRDRRFIAKLGDFGGSVLDMEEESLLQSGTQPWNAPEWREKMKKDRLPMTDIYSFGLLFWRTILRRDPFSIKALFDLPSEPVERFAAIQNLKQKDEILPMSFRSIKRGLPATQWVLNILIDSLSKDPMRRGIDRVLLAFHELEQIEDPYETTR